MSYQEQTTTDQTVAPVRDEKLATHNLFETAAADPSLSIFMSVLTQAGVEPLLRGPDLYTVLAPVNEVFAEGQQRPDLVRHHLIQGAFTEAELRASGSVKAIDGTSLDIVRAEGETRVAGARLIRADIECTNGVLHVTDSLLHR